MARKVTNNILKRLSLLRKVFLNRNCVSVSKKINIVFTLILSVQCTHYFKRKIFFVKNSLYSVQWIRVQYAYSGDVQLSETPLSLSLYCSGVYSPVSLSPLPAQLSNIIYWSSLLLELIHKKLIFFWWSYRKFSLSP